jgi:hypothetical protein
MGKKQKKRSPQMQGRSKRLATRPSPRGKRATTTTLTPTGSTSSETASKSAGDGVLVGAGKGGNVPPVAYRWKPGQSGNPGGRPKNSEKLSVILERLLLEPDQHYPQMSKGEALMRSAIANGHVDAAFLRTVLERSEGKLGNKPKTKKVYIVMHPRPPEVQRDVKTVTSQVVDPGRALQDGAAPAVDEGPAEIEQRLERIAEAASYETQSGSASSSDEDGEAPTG